MKYICNVKQTPHNGKDYMFLGNNKYPDELDYRNDLQPIRDQGNQGSCFAHCVSCVKEWQEKKDYGFDNYFSPQFFYNNRSNMYDDNKKNDEGMYGRDVMSLMKSIGICSETSYPYGKIEKKCKISNEIYKEALNHKIKGYARIYRQDTLKSNLYVNGPCIITFPVYNYGKEFWMKKQNTDKTDGGHAVVIVGYNKEGFIIRNSWGKNWGDNGYSIYKYSQWNNHWEIWTTIDAKSNYMKFNKYNKKCCDIL